MDKKWTVKKVCEKIWEIEEEERLFEISIDGIYLWELMRMQIYYLITQKLGVFDEPHEAKKNKFEKLKYGFLLLKEAVQNNPYSYKKKVNYLIYDHERKIEKNDEFIDIYSNYFVKELKEKYLIIEDPMNGKHLSLKNNNIRFNDLTYIVSGLMH